jgi:hypothetical protein
MEDGCGSGKNGYGLLDGGEAGVRNGDGVFGERDGVEMELTVRIGLGGLGEFGGLRFEDYLDVRDRAMLRIVNDASDGAEDGGKSCATEQQ